MRGVVALAIGVACARLVGFGQARRVKQRGRRLAGIGHRVGGLRVDERGRERSGRTEACLQDKAGNQREKHATHRDTHPAAQALRRTKQTEIRM